jgi:hypothetical protein
MRRSLESHELKFGIENEDDDDNNDEFLLGILKCMPAFRFDLMEVSFVVNDVSMSSPLFISFVLLVLVFGH